jgi:heptosyltransferase I
MSSLTLKSKIDKIAILFPEFLGDYINLIPFLHRLGELFPTAEVTLYIPPNMVDFAGKHPRVHRCFPFPDRSTKANRKVFASALRVENYDMAYFTNPELLWILVAAKIRYRIHDHSDFLLKLLCKGTPMRALRNRFRQVPERHIQNLDYIFGQRLPVDRYNFDAGIAVDVCDLVADLPRYVAVNPDSHSCKRYDRAFFVHVIRWLMGEGYTVVHVGLKDPHGLAADFSEDGRYRNLVGKTSLPQLMGIFRYADLFLGIDSGTAHLSSILGTPTLIFYPPKGATPAVSCLLATKALPYQYSSFESSCDLACRHYPSCAFDTCTHDYNLEDVKSRIRETMKGDLSPSARWRAVYGSSMPVLVIPSSSKDVSLKQQIMQFSQSGISVRLGSVDMLDWSFSRMLQFMHRHDVRVLFWEGRDRVPLKWRIMNRWMRFSERLFCGMTAGVLDDTPELFFERCFAALIWPLVRQD